MTDIKTLLRRAQILFNVEYVGHRTNRRNRHAWVRSVMRLGDKWLLAKRVKRL